MDKGLLEIESAKLIATSNDTVKSTMQTVNMDYSICLQNNSCTS